MGEAKTCKTDITVAISVQFDYKFLKFPIWSRCGTYVIKKNRVLATNVPICAEIYSGEKSFHFIGQVLRSPSCQTSNMAVIRGEGASGKASSYCTKPIRTTINVLKFK